MRAGQSKSNKWIGVTQWKHRVNVLEREEMEIKTVITKKHAHKSTHKHACMNKKTTSHRHRDQLCAL